MRPGAAQTTALGPRPQTTHRYFVVAKRSRWMKTGLTAELRPASTIHAKEMGTSKTVCGLACDTWTKWWGHPFLFNKADAMCSSCCALVKNTLPLGTCELCDLGS